MTSKHHKLKIGVVGCGAIGSRIARSIQKELKNECELTGIFDLDQIKARNLAKSLHAKSSIIKTSVKNLLTGCDLMVEAVSGADTKDLIHQALKAKKNILAMSIGRLLNAQNLFKLAQKNKCYILMPSGAIAGIDAIKAASLTEFKSITLTTKKPLNGFKNNPYIEQKGIKLNKIKKPTIVFSGSVDEAVKHFPYNINVAATLALACQNKNKVKVKIMTAPEYKSNTHEIELVGASGKITTRTENVTCPDNPKTSYLAVLSAIKKLKDFSAGVLIGT